MKKPHNDYNEIKEIKLTNLYDLNADKLIRDKINHSSKKQLHLKDNDYFQLPSLESRHASV